MLEIWSSTESLLALFGGALDGEWHGQIDNFLGNFFIRKCMWSTPASIKSTAASIKKFYKCMREDGKLSKRNYAELCAIIRDRMEWWQEDCAQFNDPSAANPFIPF